MISSLISFIIQDYSKCLDNLDRSYKKMVQVKEFMTTATAQEKTDLKANLLKLINSTNNTAAIDLLKTNEQE